MNTERRQEINGQVAQLERNIDAQEAARKASTKMVERLVADCRAIFVEHPSGVRVLGFLEDYFMPEATAKTLQRLSGEDVKARLADAEGARKVVRFLKAASAGNVNATEHAKT